jgi:signal transduction histidine kinase
MNKIFWKKTIFKYLLIQIIIYSVVFISVLGFYLITKDKEADLLLRNVANDVLIGDYRTVQQNLNNALASGFVRIELFNNKKAILFSSDTQKSSPFYNFVLKKHVGSSTSSDSRLNHLYFYFSIIPIISTSLLISLLFAILALPFLMYEINRLERVYKAKLLEKENQLIKDLAIQISHDIRSPLAVLNALKLEILENNLQNKKHFFEAIDRINSMASDLLLKEKEKGTVSILTTAQVELYDFLEIQMNQKKFELLLSNEDLSDIKVHNLTQSKIFCTIPSIELSRIISNLLNNSLESFSKNKENLIQINLNFIKDMAIIEIIDNGGGIPKHILKELGLSRVSSKNFTNTSGSGLGIFHAKKTIESFGGEFLIESENSNGTSITIKLPAKLENKSRQVVLIDNDELIRFIWKQKAKKANIDFRTFNGASDLEESITELNYDTEFYIDSVLDDIKGEHLAEKLFSKGFTNLNLSTGYPAENFIEYTFLKSVISKDPPF